MKLGGKKNLADLQPACPVSRSNLVARILADRFQPFNLATHSDGAYPCGPYTGESAVEFGHIRGEPLQAAYRAVSTLR